MPSPQQHPSPPRMRAGAAALGAAAALCLTACGPGSDTGSAPTSSASPAPKGVVDHKTAGSILDHYQEINNKANKTRDASLLSTVEAGQLYARSKADYEQFDTLSAKEKKDYGTPFYFTRRSFYIPPTGNWFAAEASTNGTNHTFMIFEKSADTGGTWKKVISLFPQQPLPTPGPRAAWPSPQTRTPRSAASHPAASPTPSKTSSPAAAPRTAANSPTPTTTPRPSSRPTRNAATTSGPKPR
ncbi:hypothetical protein OHB41_09395 [Streptomyces sp. NBC_01571]|uniref:hypothetical protein n=1 Tax=Streptomyces sp. NBC_01571 TaxID=2975883 RepID=UPI002257407C|nr:hypothetical protein [Streptomyces sp. NBC_01571]MCX4573392.1 hypothetical protein [Streptomyces sp. NBC_01571]